MRLSILFIILLSNLTVNAITISGKISDDKNQGLPGANVYLDGTFSGASTQTDGSYSFTTSSTGTYTLIAAFMGFDTARITIEIGNEDIAQNLQLKEKFNELQAVTITAGTYGTGDNVKGIVMSSLEMVTTAGSLGDINAAMRSLPGTSNNGESGKLFVHGGDGSETGTYIDGILVHQPFTTSAPNMAVRGRFNPFMFKGTSFSTGGYSAEYGQALSSVLTLKTKDLPEEDEWNISLMTIGGELAGTKRWEKGAVTVTGSYTNLTPYMKLVPQNYSWKKEPQAYGGAVNFRQKTNGSGMLKIYSSADYSQLSQNRNQGLAQGLMDIENTNSFTNINWHGSLSEKWYVTVGSSLTYNTDEFSQNENNLKETLRGNHIKSTIKYNWTEKFKVRTGAEHFYTDFSRKFSRENIDGDSTVGFEENISAAFLETQTYISNKLLFNVGVRVEHSKFSNETQWSPRFSVGYKVGKDGNISAAFGKYTQSPNSQDRINREYLQNQHAYHYLVSYSKTKEKRTFRSEIYYKEYKNLVKYHESPMPFTNDGSGYAYGLDLYFKDQKTIKNGTYWISYSYLKTERNFLHYPHSAVPTFAVPHSLTVVYKHWVPNWRTYFGASFRYGSPRVYTDLNEGSFNGSKMPAYSSLDINCSYVHRPNIIFYTSISNVLGVDQVFGYDYSIAENPNDPMIKSPILPPAKRFFFVGCFITLSKSGDKNQLDKINN